MEKITKLQNLATVKLKNKSFTKKTCFNKKYGYSQNSST